MEGREKIVEKEIDNKRYNQLESGDVKEILDIALKLWSKRKSIIKFIVFFIILGLFFSIITPNEYTASTTMVPQTGEKKAPGGISGLAAMAGINLGNLSSGEVLSPSVYPQILNNINFQKELLYSKFTINKEKYPVSYYDYITNKKYRKFHLMNSLKRIIMFIPNEIIGEIIPSTSDDEIGNIDNPDIKSLTLAESKAIKDLFKNLLLNMNEREGYIALSFKSDEAKLSAEVVLTAQKLLQKYITLFKIEKVKSNLDFVEMSYNEAKLNFEEKQAELARFRDANINLSSAIAKTYEEKLTSEYNLLLGVYTEIAKQKEQAKIAVTETTPLITIIIPVVIPNEKSGPKRVIMIIGFLLLGLASGIGWTLGQPYIKEINAKMKQS